MHILTLRSRIVDVLKDGNSLTRLQTEKMARDLGIDNRALVRDIVESAVVIMCRRLANETTDLKTAFDNIVEVYSNQPNLSMRSSRTVSMQQYSTSPPLAFMMGVFAGMPELKKGEHVVTGDYGFDPSAGNGMLTIAAPWPRTRLVDVNEYDATRHALLQLLDEDYYLNIFRRDASVPFADHRQKYYKSVVTNPPFGLADRKIVFGDRGKFTISSKEMQMAIYAMDTMRNDGRVAIIIGGHTQYDKQGRIQSGNNRNFYQYLHQYYNVVDYFNIDGHKLYHRMGTAFNVRMILIDGRKATPSGNPPLVTQIEEPIGDWETYFYRMKSHISGKVNSKHERLLKIATRLSTKLNTSLN